MKGFGGMQQLMRQANQMQNKIKKLQEELNTREYDGTSGGGACKVTVNGEYQLQNVELSKDVIDPEDVEMLQDLILSACNDALKTAKETTDKEMSKVTGGFGLPGM